MRLISYRSRIFIATDTHRCLHTNAYANDAVAVARDRIRSEGWKNTEWLYHGISGQRVVAGGGAGRNRERESMVCEYQVTRRTWCSINCGSACNRERTDIPRILYNNTHPGPLFYLRANLRWSFRYGIPWKIAWYVNVRSVLQVYHTILISNTIYSVDLVRCSTYTKYVLLYSKLWE